MYMEQSLCKLLSQNVIAMSLFKILIGVCLSISRLFWVLSLAYPNLLGTKRYVVVVVVVVVVVGVGLGSF
jgi:hypothetical protein